MSDWNAKQYIKFEKERTQPSLDLISRIADLSPKRIIDIGCGPGNSTKKLKDAFPSSEIIGVDASDDMLKKARESYPDIAFEKCFLPQGLKNIDGKFDLIFSNACIHWIPEQHELIEAFFDKLTSGGTVAVQIPLTSKAPFYKLLFELVKKDEWKKLSDIKNFHNLSPEEYYDCFSLKNCDFSIWQTTYYHTVSSHEGIIDWYKGSGLRPYLDRLDDAKKEKFISELLDIIKSVYPVQKDGSVILKMPRLFFTVTKK